LFHLKSARRSIRVYSLSAINWYKILFEFHNSYTVFYTPISIGQGPDKKKLWPKIKRQRYTKTFMTDFLTNSKKENSIKKVYIDDHLHSKTIYRNGVWVPVCIKDSCTEVPVRNDLCKTHIRETALIEPGTIVSKGSIKYVWSGVKWKLKCVICSEIADKSGYCQKHSSLKSSGTDIGSIADIYQSIMESRTN
jgi:hypothetical protein